MSKKSRNITKFMLVLLIVTGLLNLNKSYAQVNQDSLAKAGMLTVLSFNEDMRAIKLANQNTALGDIKQAIDLLKSGGDPQKVLEKSVDAIEVYSRFSTPYLLAAFASYQKNNFLDAHRFLLMYDAKKARGENIDMSKDIPPSFVAQLRQQINAGFAKLTAKDLDAFYKKERWKDHSLNLGFDFSMRDFGDSPSNGATNNGDIADMDYPLTFKATYSQFIWLNKDKAFPTNAANNLGLEFKVGYSYTAPISNDAITTENTAFFTPGVYWGKLYFSPGRLYFNSRSDYTLDNNIASQKNSIISFSPELRLYAAFSEYAAQANGTSALKNKENPAGFVFYAYLKSDQEQNSGEQIEGTSSGSTKTITYFTNERDYMAGIAVGTKHFELTAGGGAGTFQLLSTATVLKPASQTSYYNINSTTFMAHIGVMFRIL